MSFIVCILVQEPPYLTTKKDNPTSNADFEGYIPDLLVELARQPGCECNFTLKLVKDGKYGVQGKNLEWSGMIGEVIRGVRTKCVCFRATVQLYDRLINTLNYTRQSKEELSYRREKTSLLSRHKILYLNSMIYLVNSRR